jgi:hypothetical protein
LLAGLAASRLDFGVHQTDGFRYTFARVFDGVHRFLREENN